MNLRSGSNNIKPSVQFFTNKPNLDNPLHLHQIHIPVIKFESSTSCDPFEVRKNWFINLSSTSIPQTVVSLMQFGEKFSLSPTNKKHCIFYSIKDIENDIRFLPLNNRTEVRVQIFPTLDRFANHPSPLSDLDSNLIDMYKRTKIFIDENPDIIFTKADKGNITVALDFPVYLDKVNVVLYK